MRLKKFLVEEYAIMDCTVKDPEIFILIKKYIYIFSALLVYTRDPIENTWTFLELAFKTTMTQMQLKKKQQKTLGPCFFFLPTGLND